MPRRLIYVSALVQPMPPAELRALEARAAAFNAERAVTGLLVCFRDGFLQALEGDAAAIDCVMARVRSDKRHRNVFVVIDEHDAARVYPEWSMRVVAASVPINDEVQP